MDNKIMFYDPELAIKITYLASKELERLDHELRKHDLKLFGDNIDGLMSKFSIR